MKKRLALLLGWAAVAVATTLTTSCGSASGTFVLVTIAVGNAPSTGVVDVDLVLDFNGQTSTVQIKNGGADIALPGTKSLEIKDGAGELKITAIANNAAGAEIIRGVSYVAVARDSTKDVTVTFGVTEPDPNNPDLAKLTADTMTFDFGDVASGVSRTKTITISNTGTAATTGNLTPSFSGAGAAAFSIMPTSPPNCSGNMQLAVSGICQVVVQFLPTAAGAKAADLTVKADSGASVIVHFMGNGT